MHIFGIFSRIYLGLAVERSVLTTFSADDAHSSLASGFLDGVKPCSPFFDPAMMTVSAAMMTATNTTMRRWVFILLLLTTSTMAATLNRGVFLLFSFFIYLFNNVTATSGRPPMDNDNVKPDPGNIRAKAKHARLEMSEERR